MSSPTTLLGSLVTQPFRTENQASVIYSRSHQNPESGDVPPRRITRRISLRGTFTTGMLGREDGGETHGLMPFVDHSVRRSECPVLLRDQNDLSGPSGSQSTARPRNR